MVKAKLKPLTISCGYLNKVALKTPLYEAELFYSNFCLKHVTFKIGRFSYILSFV